MQSTRACRSGPAKSDGSAKSPISALRCISKSLWRKYVRLTPLRFARLELGAFFETVWFLTFFPVHQN
jgi:hypothetical protein